MDRKFHPQGHWLASRGYTFCFPMFYFRSSIHYQTYWCWPGTYLNLTSLWCQPIDKVVWRPTQQMPTEFMWNFSCFILTWVRSDFLIWYARNCDLKMLGDSYNLLSQCCSVSLVTYPWSTDDFPEVDVHPVITADKVTVVCLSILQLHQLQTNHTCCQRRVHLCKVNVLKFWTPKKKEHPKFIFSPHQWSKGK